MVILYAEVTLNDDSNAFAGPSFALEAVVFGSQQEKRRNLGLLLFGELGRWTWSFASQESLNTSLTSSLAPLAHSAFSDTQSLRNFDL